MSSKTLTTTFGFAALAVAGFTAPASAAPLTLTLESGAAVETVAYGCGRGFAPNAWGHCRPIYRGYGYYGPRRYGYGPRYYGPGISVGLPGARLSFY